MIHSLASLLLYPFYTERNANTCLLRQHIWFTFCVFTSLPLLFFAFEAILFPRNYPKHIIFLWLQAAFLYFPLPFLGRVREASEVHTKCRIKITRNARQKRRYKRRPNSDIRPFPTLSRETNSSRYGRRAPAWFGSSLNITGSRRRPLNY